MGDTPVRTAMPETQPVAPRRPWSIPVVEHLGDVTDLTLQGGSLSCEGNPEDCFPDF
jgi:hypothetical protein